MEIHNNVLSSNNIFGQGAQGADNMNTLTQSEQSENYLKKSANFGGFAAPSQKDLSNQSIDNPKNSMQEPVSIHRLISGSIMGTANEIPTDLSSRRKKSQNLDKTSLNDSMSDALQYTKTIIDGSVSRINEDITGTHSRINERQPGDDMGDYKESVIMALSKSSDINTSNIGNDNTYDNL